MHFLHMSFNTHMSKIFIFSLDIPFAIILKIEGKTILQRENNINKDILNLILDTLCYQ